ncbi:hypothetical protein RchiOBHm_Chr6g0284811 [Rosa chinensis]|uniref:Uncharacterized protein n=1 Tax=Rosa chinensis TaxID=74649 RepID=A0A2P6PUE4_ROSCH|nr:hypothetical protein RchiOBHm_Chr6g0284811 [Rosa chinensis]
MYSNMKYHSFTADCLSCFFLSTGYISRVFLCWSLFGWLDHPSDPGQSRAFGIGFFLRERPVFAIATATTVVGIWTIFPYAVAALTALFLYLRQRYSTLSE